MFHYWLSGIRSGFRGRSFHAAFLFGLFLIFIAYLSGSFSPRQPRTVALDVGLSGVRFTLVLLNLFWIQELVTKEIERKSVLFSLTYPVSRDSYLLGRYLSVCTLSALAAIVLLLCLEIVVVLAGVHYDQEHPVALGWPLVITMVGLWFDVATVAGFALWIATLSTVQVMPLALGLAFAIAGKALGVTLDYLAGGADGDPELLATYGPLVDTIKWILPDLSRLDWRNWPMYGLAPDKGSALAAVVMALSYTGVLVVLSARRFRRREFS